MLAKTADIFCVQRMRTCTWVFLLLALPAFGGLELDSRWPTEGVSVDGQMDDWENRYGLIDDGRMGLGISNDEEYLYLVLFLPDWETQRSVLGRGLEVWFDALGKKNKRFGIRFPGRMRSPGRQTNMGERPSGPPDGFPLDPDSEVTLIEVLRPELSPGIELSLKRAAEVGIEAAMSQTEQGLVIELKVPLQESESKPYGINSLAGERIGVGLVTPKREKSGSRGSGMQRGGMGMGPGGGGMRGGKGSGMGRGMGGQGKGMGSGQGGEDFKPPEAVKIWAKVNLSVDKP